MATTCGPLIVVYTSLKRTGSNQMKARTRKRTGDGALLTSVAESIGSALGTIAAKANAAQKVLTRSSVVHSVDRGAKKFVGKGKSSAQTTTSAARARAKTH